MSVINRIMTLIFDVLFAPFVAAPGWLSLIVFSAIASVAGLLVYKYTSNQASIKRVKDRIKANMLAIKLFKDDLGVMFRSQAKTLVCALHLLRYSLLPMAVMIVPFVLVVAQLALRYQWRPLQPGETVVMTAQLTPGHDVTRLNPILEPSEGAVCETPPVRIASLNQVVWLLRATAPGRHVLRLRMGGEVVEKSIDVGDGFRRVSALRSNGSFVDAVLHPGETPLPADSAVQSIALDYPARDSWFYGETFWLIWLIALSFVVALLVKPALGVEF